MYPASLKNAWKQNFRNEEMTNAEIKKFMRKTVKETVPYLKIIELFERMINGIDDLIQYTENNGLSQVETPSKD